MGRQMEPKYLIRSFKRFIVAFAFGCSILVGVAGTKPLVTQNQATTVDSTPADEVAIIIPIGNLIPTGNFWSG